MKDVMAEMRLVDFPSYESRHVKDVASGNWPSRFHLHLGINLIVSFLAVSYISYSDECSTKISSISCICVSALFCEVLKYVVM